MRHAHGTVRRGGVHGAGDGRREMARCRRCDAPQCPLPDAGRQDGRTRRCRPPSFRLAALPSRSGRSGRSGCPPDSGLVRSRHAGHHAAPTGRPGCPDRPGCRCCNRPAGRGRGHAGPAAACLRDAVDAARATGGECHARPGLAARADTCRCADAPVRRRAARLAHRPADRGPLHARLTRQALWTASPSRPSTWVAARIS